MAIYNIAKNKLKFVLIMTEVKNKNEMLSIFFNNNGVQAQNTCLRQIFSIKKY